MIRNSYFRRCIITTALTLLLFVIPTVSESSSSPNDSLGQSNNDTSLDQVTKPSEVEEENAPQFENINKLMNTVNKPAGGSLRLQCLASGNPLPNITWTRNDMKIERALGKVIYKKWSIQLDDVISSDSGSYKCLVCNKHGCIEHITQVAVIDRFPSRPYISENYPKNQTVFTNSSTYLECRVESDLEPYIYWVKYTQKNEPIEQPELMISNNGINKKSEDVVILENDPANPNILRFTNVSHRDEGWYACVATNSLGKTMANAYLRVVDKQSQGDGLQISHSGRIIIGGIVVVVLILVGSIYIVYVLRNLKYLKPERHNIEMVYQWTKKVIIIAPPLDDNSGVLQIPVIKFEKQRVPLISSPDKNLTISYSEYEFPVDTNWEIPRSKLSLGSILGEGCFGRVVMARARGLNSMATTVVAVKMVKDDYTDSDVASLVREMELMKMIGKHVNIINLLGCCSQNGPLWVIVEFARYGNLKDFLIENRPLDMEKKINLKEKRLISFALQIAQGMEYLASRRCIHRDLAARNVLVSDDYIMKIADFGLARDIQDKDYYRKNTSGRLPIKWMAPESLQNQFYNSQSDVWSYGVLLWEIMTFGEQPYANIMSAEELYNYLIIGKRMAMPTGCSHKIYALMQKCWHIDFYARPTFTEIVVNLKEIVQLSSIRFNTRYVNLPKPVIKITLAESDEESIAESYTPMFGNTK